MAPFLIAGIFSLIVAPALIAGVVRLAREQRSPVLFSFLFYVIFWYALVLYTIILYFSPQILPAGVKRGYLLYNAIFIVPFHGLVAYFFTDFMIKMLGRNMPKLLKLAIPVCFVLIWFFYAREMWTQLSMETTRFVFDGKTSFSGYLLFAFLFGGILYASIVGRSLQDCEKKRFVLMYSAVTTVALLTCLFVVAGVLSFLRMEWQTTITSMVMAAANVPGWFYLRRYLKKRARATAPELANVDLSMLEERYGVTTREREVISLVITGRSNREITEDLFISPETVKKHIYNAYRKIGVRNRVQLVNAVLESRGERF
jgi:DNA-binding CsgD family transcriptional regulator